MDYQSVLLTVASVVIATTGMKNIYSIIIIFRIECLKSNKYKNV